MNAVFGVILTALLFSCAPPRERPEATDLEPSSGKPESPERRQSDIDRLRSLPYAGYTTEPSEDRGSGTVFLDEERSYPGYNLYSVRDLCRAELVTADGRLLHSWQDEECSHWSHAELLPDGDLLVTGMRAHEGRSGPLATRSDRFLLRLRWNGEVVFRAEIPAHHDAELTPGGAMLVLTLGTRSTTDHGEPILDNALVVADAQTGEVLEERSLYELFAATPEVPLQPIRPDKGVVDLFHANSVEWIRPLPGRPGSPSPIRPGHVLLSSRHQDLIATIDWQGRHVAWSWGAGELSGPHDATLLDNGNVLVFDNGLERGWSRVLEVDPATEEIVWHYQTAEKTDFFTASRGSSQRLPNGNTLIAESDRGRAFEVTAYGEIVWDYLCPHFDDAGHRATIVRIKRYEPGFVRDAIQRQRRRAAAQ